MRFFWFFHQKIFQMRDMGALSTQLFAQHEYNVYRFKWCFIWEDFLIIVVCWIFVVFKEKNETFETKQKCWTTQIGKPMRDAWWCALLFQKHVLFKWIVMWFFHLINERIIRNVEWWILNIKFVYTKRRSV